jgi:ubiquinone/menaquinone biosynthesis C-methylase UbiE
MSGFLYTGMVENPYEEEPVFDSIAEYYDETREPLREEVLAFLIEHLKGSEDILEIGAGTGRISIPLQDAGFKVTGADISRKMLERAKSKGLKNTVIADGSNLPFEDGSFDVTLLVHVFHLINDRKRVMKEAMRVSRKCVMSIIRVRDNNSGFKEPRGEIRDILMEVSSESGISLGQRDRENYNHRFEATVIDELPPDRMLEIGVFQSTISKDQIARKIMSSSGYVRRVRGMSSDMRKKIESEFMKRISLIPDFQVTRKSTEYLAIWDKSDI